MGKDKYVRFDWAAKSLLRNKENFEILEGLIEVLLDVLSTAQKDAMAEGEAIGLEKGRAEGFHVVLVKLKESLKKDITFVKDSIKNKSLCPNLLFGRRLFCL